MTRRFARYRRPLAMLVAATLIGVGGVEYAHHVRWAGALETLRHVSLPLLLLATGFHFLSLMAKARVWLVCLRALGAIDYGAAARATFVGATLNSLFVGSAGEAGRVVIMTRSSGLRAHAVLTTVALERLLNSAGFVVVLCVALLITPMPSSVGRAALVAGALVVIAVTLTLRSDRRSVRPPGSARRACRFQRIMRVTVRRVRRNMVRILTLRRLALAVPLTLLDWTCQLASYHLAALAAHLPLGITGSLVALLAVNVGLVIRVTPGNLGVFELAYAGAAHSLGAPKDAALAVGLLIHLAQDIPTMVLGLAAGWRLAFAPNRAPGSAPGQPAVAHSRIPSLSSGETP